MKKISKPLRKLNHAIQPYRSYSQRSQREALAFVYLIYRGTTNWLLTFDFIWIYFFLLWHNWHLFIARWQRKKSVAFVKRITRSDRCLHISVGFLLYRCDMLDLLFLNSITNDLWCISISFFFVTSRHHSVLLFLLQKSYQ